MDGSRCDGLVQRRTAELLKGRCSISSAVYFVTFCTERRAPTLRCDAVYRAAYVANRKMETTGDARFLAATVMPDHVHLLFELGSRLSLDRVVSKWKAQVRRTVSGVVWQANFFEHHLRPDELREPYAWYVFMNPYRAGLIDPDEVWRGWYPASVLRWEFLEIARPGPCPQPEWLAEWDRRATGLVTGE
jgi:putative transposase